MRKYVYLFELDSIRKSDEEIILGQQTLYDEIVKNGNIVVLTYNQLLDSRAFFSLLNHEEYYSSIIHLFEKGCIRISQFGTIRTLAQYLLNTIDSDKKFIYSCLPIKSSQRRLIELIKRSIMHSDLSEIKEYIDCIHKTDEDLRDLFIEVEENASGEYILQKTQLNRDEIDKVLQKLYTFITMVLRISPLHSVYIAPKEEKEYVDYKMFNYLSYVTKLKLNEDKDRLWNKAIEIIENLNSFKNESSNRSVYFHELIEKQNSIDFASYQYAEAIVSICTNYAYEMSICNISKHYNIDDLKQVENFESSFFQDFYQRLQQHWDDGKNANSRFLQAETNRFYEFARLDKLPNFFKAVRIVDKLEQKETIEKIYRYEYNIKQQRKIQKYRILRKLFVQMISLLCAVILVMGINLIFEIGHNILVQDFESLLSWYTFLQFGIDTIFFFILGEFFSNLISKIVPNLLSLSEATRGLIESFFDAFYLIFTKSNTYMSNVHIDSVESKNKEAEIKVLETKELRKYKQLAKKRPDLMQESNIYSLANIWDSVQLKAIIRNEELYRKNYGVVYSSAFNQLIVDPIVDKKNDFFAYERIIPTSSNKGVVLFVLCQDKVILLKQYRHALRQEQLCCPRGFGEDKQSNIENAKKELYEELNAVCIEEPVELGTVCADSGLSSGKAIVYLMKIEKYDALKKEGICEVVEFKIDELWQCIQSGLIEDGYTLSACSLYRAYLLNLAE